MSSKNLAYVNDADETKLTPVESTKQNDFNDIQISTNFSKHSGNSSSGSSFSSFTSATTSGDGSPKRIRLTWTDVSVKAMPKKGLLGRAGADGKQILHGVSGYAEPGSLLAIMGSSGAGKSTLLNMLTWRNRRNLQVDGEILCNGVALGPNITGVSAYVQQDDLFMGELTVKEHLTFTARLRMDSSTTDEERSKRVHDVIKQMGLKKCEGTQIGTPGRTKTISGGEMKRLSFAAELLTNPSILFCDEPTSGLDSYLAKVIVECMRTVSKQGCTVLCTIHQPSSEVFELFDRLLLLALGQVVFHGDAKDAITHYANIGYPCPANYNPADHYIMAISVIPGDEEASKQIIEKFAENYSASSYNMEVKKRISLLEENHEDRNAMMVEIREMKKKPRYRVGFFEQSHACVVRAFKTTYRNPTLTRVKVIQTLFAAIIVGLVYLRPNFYKPYLSSDVMTVCGSLFLVITNTTFTSAIGVLNAFPAEIPIFRREHFNGMYSTAVYFISKNLADLPTYLVLPFVYSIVVYFMFGLFPTAAKFFIFYGFLALLANTCVSYGYMIACLSPSIGVAIALGPALLMPLLLLGGFFISASQIPVYLIWLKYLSWFFYTNELLNINQWEYVGYLGCPAYNATYNSTLIDTSPGPCLYENGQAVLSSLGFHQSNFGRDIGLMFALLFGFRAVALAFLYYRVRESTR
ncbi:unnamed protein product [Clavelina lepadiformis]|uniref:ABC transporter domain-containing protein n=1 Tax=Clavelina lepadiformis TaxID=159417 RepID=A0ABP0GW27_CLALP